MKNLLTATLPALALLALGGCATSGALTTSTESDGVYYSSKDRTTSVASAAPAYGDNSTAANAPAADDTDANPDYQGGSQSGGAGTDYYSYNTPYNGSGFGQPYTGPGVSYYNYSPSWSVAPSFYTSPWAYGMYSSPYSYGFGAYPYGGFYDPFFSPYYSPWGFRSGVSLSFGYGFGYPYGGFGYPAGYYAYDPFFGYGGYGYGRGYYGYSGGYYNRPVIYANGTRGGSGDGTPILVGPRERRGGSVLNNANGSAAPVYVGGGRNAAGSNSTGNVAAPVYSSNAVQPQNAAYGQVSKAGRPATNFGGGEVVGQPVYSVPGSGNAAPQGPNTGRRGFFSGFFGGGNAANTAPANSGMQPSRQRRDFGQPQYSGGGQPSYSQPQPSYNQQSRFSQPVQPSYSQPSYSQPSRSFGGGGGNFGGGSSSGGGGVRRGGR